MSEKRRARQRNDGRRLLRLGAWHDQRHGYFCYLYFDNTQTVTNVTINLGNTSGYWDQLSAYDTADAGNQVLTLASSVTVDVQGNAIFNGSGDSGDGIVNDGAIDRHRERGLSEHRSAHVHQ